MTGPVLYTAVDLSGKVHERRQNGVEWMSALAFNCHAAATDNNV